MYNSKEFNEKILTVENETTETLHEKSKYQKILPQKKNHGEMSHSKKNQTKKSYGKGSDIKTFTRNTD